MINTVAGYQKGKCAYSDKRIIVTILLFCCFPLYFAQLANKLT